MGISRRIGIAVITAALAAGAGAGRAGSPPQQSAVSPPVDEELLEFLGSVESPADSTQQPDDDAWLAYLSRVDLGKVAKASQTPAQAPAQAKPANTAAGTEKPHE